VRVDKANRLLKNSLRGGLEGALNPLDKQLPADFPGKIATASCHRELAGSRRLYFNGLLEVLDLEVAHENLVTAHKANADPTFFDELRVPAF